MAAAAVINPLKWIGFIILVMVVQFAIAHPGPAKGNTENTTKIPPDKCYYVAKIPCSEYPDGENFPHPTECKKFIKCNSSAENGVVTKRCDTGKLYNHSSGWCEKSMEMDDCMCPSKNEPGTTDQTSICPVHEDYGDKEYDNPSGCFEINATKLAQKENIVIDFYVEKGTNDPQCAGQREVDLIENKMNLLTYFIDTKKILKLKMNNKDLPTKTNEIINMKNLKISTIKIFLHMSSNITFQDIKIAECKNEPSSSASSTFIIIGTVIAVIIIIAIVAVVLFCIKKMNSKFRNEQNVAAFSAESHPADWSQQTSGPGAAGAGTTHVDNNLYGVI